MDQWRVGGCKVVSTIVYMEGGGDSKDGKIRCREGFRNLLEKCGLIGRMPTLVACGSRDSAYDRFKIAYTNASGTDYVVLMIDSEGPLSDIDKTWVHLGQRDGWQRPQGAQDDQVMFMTTCMETWIVADRHALGDHFGQHLQASALPSLDKLEGRSRSDVQSALAHATRNCPSPYVKGPKSFQVLSHLNPDTIGPHLPSFRRARRILETHSQ